MTGSVTRIQASTFNPRNSSTSSRYLQWWAAAMVALPVFIQAPWVRQQPFSACLFTGVILCVGILLQLKAHRELADAGALLVGLSGSWLAGCLFWGWLRAAPIWHLPIESIALPWALTGLRSRWQLGCAFYLASLLGTVCTDITMILARVMEAWPVIVTAPLATAPTLLHDTATRLLEPLPSLVVCLAATGVILLSRQAHNRAADTKYARGWAVAASVLLATLVVDGSFFFGALMQPRLSGLI